MANTIPSASVFYDGDGSTTQYPVTFEYLDKAYVFATVDGADATFTWTTDNTIEFTTAPAVGTQNVNIYRTTAADAMLAVFSEDTPFLPKYVDKDYTQLLHLVQEANSGSIDRDNTEEAAREAADASILATVTANYAKTLRTPDAVAQVPYTASQRANKVLAFDSSGNPSVIVPTSGSAADVLLQLATSAGASMIGTTTSGTLADVVTDVTPEQFGAVGDGAADDTAALFAAAALANSTGRLLRLGPNRTYRLVGTSDWVVYYSVDGRGAVLDVSDFTGRVYFNRPPEAQPTTYTAGSTVVDTLAGATIPRMTQHITQWHSVDEVSDSYVLVKTSQPYVDYRGTIYTRTEYLRSYRQGAIEIPLRYDLSGDLVTSVDVYPNPKRVETIENINFYSSKGPTANSVTVTRTGVNLRNLRFNDDNIVMTAGTQWLTIHTSFNVAVDGVYFSHALLRTSDGTESGTLEAAYCIGMWYSYDLRFRDVRAAGEGWGPLGGFECSNVWFDKCVLGRVDFHIPFRNFLKITDSVLLDDCIRVQGIGDLIIDGCYLTNDTAKNYSQSSPAVINTRGDAGGYISGDVIIRNCRARFPIATNARLMTFEAAGSGSAGVPSGSPIPKRSCGSYQVLNLALEQADGYITHVMYTEADTTRPAPEFVVIDGVRGSRVRVQMTLPTVAYAPISAGVLTASGFNFHITVRDVATCDQLQLIDPTVATGYVVNAVIHNIRPASGYAPSAAVLKVRGRVVISDSVLDRVSTQTGSAVTYWNLTHIRDCVLYPTDVVLTPMTSNTAQLIKATGCTVVGGTDAQRATLAYAECRNCSGMDSTGVVSEILLTTDFAGTSGDKGLLGNGALYSLRNPYKVITDTGTYGLFLPQSGTQSVVVMMGASAYVTAKVSTARTVVNLTGTGVSNFRYLALGN